jgi:hypothetical protein
VKNEFYNTIRLLEQLKYTYNKHEKRGNISINILTPKEKRVKEALSRLLGEKNKEYTKIIEDIMEKIYADIKNTPFLGK